MSPTIIAKALDAANHELTFTLNETSVIPNDGASVYIVWLPASIAWRFIYRESTDSFDFAPLDNFIQVAGESMKPMSRDDFKDEGFMWFESDKALRFTAFYALRL